MTPAAVGERRAARTTDRLGRSALSDAPVGEQRGRRAAHPAVRPAVVMTLVVVSVVPWRTDTIWSGGLDPVVVAKALLAAVGLVVALTGASSVPAAGVERPRLGPVAVLLLLAYLGVSLVGGVAAGLTVPTAVLTVRVLMVAVTVLVVVRRTSPDLVLRSLVLATGLVGGLAAVTGLPGVLAGGRLTGAVPAVSPNEIALLLGLPLIGVVQRLLVEPATLRRVALLLALVAGFVATDSRAAFVSLLVGVAVALAAARRVRAVAAGALAVALPVAVSLLVTTDVVTSVVERDGDAASVATLNSRTIAWNTVLQTDPTTWPRWIGSGLSVKQVAVVGQYWQEQVLDSSWISSLAQAGVVGAALLLAGVLLGAGAAARATFRVAGFPPVLPVFVFLAIRSVVESGLVDSSTAFVAFFTVVVLAESAPRPRRAALVVPPALLPSRPLDLRSVSA